MFVIIILIILFIGYKYKIIDDNKKQEFCHKYFLKRDLLENECNQNCNHLVLNRYENENDYIGYHRDKTKSLVPNSKVIVLSLGDTRTMDIQYIYKVNGKNKTKKIKQIKYEEKIYPKSQNAFRDFARVRNAYSQSWADNLDDRLTELTNSQGQIYSALNFNKESLSIFI